MHWSHSVFVSKDCYFRNVVCNAFLCLALINKKKGNTHLLLVRFSQFVMWTQYIWWPKFHRWCIFVLVLMGVIIFLLMWFLHITLHVLWISFYSSDFIFLIIFVKQILVSTINLYQPNESPTPVTLWGFNAYLANF